MFQFRSYQTDIIQQASEVLNSSNFVYLTMEVRTGKTLTALGIAQKVAKQEARVLFITKKKAISSINDDYDLLNPNFNLFCINYESLHKLGDVRFDFIIIDEAHNLGAFPKVGKRHKQVTQIVKQSKGCKIVLLSGTPTPETFSQIYHQLNFIPNNPFAEYSNFYKWAKVFVNVGLKYIGSMQVKDYTDAKADAILNKIAPYMISYTQQQAGFKAKVKEHFITCKMQAITGKLMAQIKKDRVIEGSSEVILADTPVKLLSKVHQLSGGTIKFDSGNVQVIDHSKAKYIKEYFKGKKIAIFYKFKGELKALSDAFGNTLTTDLKEFNTGAKNIALQIVSGREGISLKAADCLVMYNVDFSATSYWQSRDRLTTKNREVNNVYWVFSDCGIEQEVYNAVSKKKDYTLAHFKQNHLNNPNTLF